MFGNCKNVFFWLKWNADNFICYCRCKETMFKSTLGLNWFNDRHISGQKSALRSILSAYFFAFEWSAKKCSNLSFSFHCASPTLANVWKLQKFIFLLKLTMDYFFYCHLKETMAEPTIDLSWFNHNHISGLKRAIRSILAEYVLLIFCFRVESKGIPYIVLFISRCVSNPCQYWEIAKIWLKWTIDNFFGYYHCKETMAKPTLGLSWLNRSYISGLKKAIGSISTAYFFW